MKTLVVTLATNEFVERNGKLYHKEIRREWISDKGTEFDTTWGVRANELLNQGKTFFEVATTLNAEGYRSKQGKFITESTIRCRKWYLKKTAQKGFLK